MLATVDGPLWAGLYSPPQVVGQSNQTVTWSIEQGLGTIDNTGLYTAPRDASGGPFHIVATSQAIPSAKGSAAVAVLVPQVMVAPASATLAPGGTQTFTATVKGLVNTDVTWAIQELGGGSISDTGFYEAPQITGIYHVVTTSVENAAISGSASITVTASSGRFTPTGSMQNGRGLHTGTLLPSGRVLMAGGSKRLEPVCVGGIASNHHALRRLDPGPVRPRDRAPRDQGPTAGDGLQPRRAQRRAGVPDRAPLVGDRTARGERALARARAREPDRRHGRRRAQAARPAGRGVSGDRRDRAHRPGAAGGDDALAGERHRDPARRGRGRLRATRQRAVRDRGSVDGLVHRRGLRARHGAGARRPGSSHRAHRAARTRRHRARAVPLSVGERRDPHHARARRGRQPRRRPAAGHVRDHAPGAAGRAGAGGSGGGGRRHRRRAVSVRGEGGRSLRAAAREGWARAAPATSRSSTASPKAKWWSPPPTSSSTRRAGCARRSRVRDERSGGQEQRGGQERRPGRADHRILRAAPRAGAGRRRSGAGRRRRSRFAT